MKTAEPGGPMAGRIAEFVEHKRMQGYDYRTGAEELRRFDRFLARIGYERAVPDASCRGRAGRRASVRQAPPRSAN